MIPIRDDRQEQSLPIITWTLIALNCILFLWDREGSLLGSSVVFADLALVPKYVVESVPKGDGLSLATLLTSMFLHANLVHLFGNLIFLLVFGGGVESAFGPIRFMLYYFFWGFAASATHIFVDPNSAIPMLGASGAIGGVLGCYFLLYPANKVEIWIPLFFTFVEVSAWVLLGIWFLYQIFIPQTGVANWAHAGGFLAGMLTVLIAGGRERMLGRSDESIPGAGKHVA